jgi:hypothetical protein
MKLAETTWSGAAAERVGRQGENRWTSGPALVAYISLAALLGQLLTATRYGCFRDELYYLACGEHPAWGYVDHPPLTPWLAWVVRHVAGTSLPATRFLPALAGAATAWLAGRMARQLGGGRWAQAVAALCVLLAPAYLLFFHLLTVNAFEPLFWTAAAYIVLRVMQTGDQKLWLWFGAIAGVGLENKYGMLFFGFGVAVGLLLTRERKAYTKPWIWAGFALAMLLWAPNLLWEVRHHWPFLELMHNVRRSGRDVALSPMGFLAQQVFFMMPLSAPVWLGGLWWYVAGREHEGARRGRYAPLGWTFVVVYLTFMLLHGKFYYVTPVYPMLLAAGGVALEQRRARGVATAYVLVLVIAGVLMAPLALPVLSPETYMAYVKALHIPMPEVEHQRLGRMEQQVYADMFGWEEMARETARAYASLPPDIRAKTAIAASNFGEAGAIDLFGGKYGLPKAISGHQSYWFWGPRDYTGESILLLGDGPRRVRELCAAYDVVGHVYHPLSRRDEHFDIYWCHPMKWNLQEIWDKAKHWN